MWELPILRGKRAIQSLACGSLGKEEERALLLWHLAPWGQKWSPVVQENEVEIPFLNFSKKKICNGYIHSRGEGMWKHGLQILVLLLTNTPERAPSPAWSSVYLTVKQEPSNQGYGFSSSHVWMWGLDYTESRSPKNWCFWTMVLEKTLESPLDCKKIKPVNPKGNQFWIFIGRTDAEAPILWPPDVKNWLIGKDPDAGKVWRWEEKGTTEDEMAGWHHRLNGHEFE